MALTRRASQMSMESVNMGGGITSRKNSQISDRRDSQLSVLGGSRRSSSAYGMDFSVSDLIIFFQFCHMLPIQSKIIWKF